MRRVVLFSLLVAVLVWPGIHFGLYRSCAIDAWKSFGWAMYARPRNAWRIAAFEVRQGNEVPIDILTEGDEAVRAIYEETLRKVRALGTLADVDYLATRLLDTRDGLENVRIRLIQTGFDCDTTHVERLATHTSDFQRDPS